MSKLASVSLVVLIIALPILGYIAGMQMLMPQYKYAQYTTDFYHKLYTSALQDGQKQLDKQKDYRRIISNLQTELEVKPKEVIKEVPVIQTVNVTVEKIIEKPQLLKEFSSLDELQAWVDKHKIPTIMLPSADNMTFNFNGVDERYDCEDYARDFQNLAALDGYQISQVLIGADGYLFGTRVTMGGGMHMSNFARIGNYYYYIESSPGSNQGSIVKLENFQFDSVEEPFISMVKFLAK